MKEAVCVYYRNGVNPKKKELEILFLLERLFSDVR